MRQRWAIWGLAIATVVLLGLAAATARAADTPAPLTLQELLELKLLGFSEADIRAEVTRSKAAYEFTEEEFKRLAEAGFSEAFLDFLRRLRPVRKLTNQDIVDMVQRGRTAVDMLRDLRTAEGAFDTSPRTLLQLSREHHVPRVVLRAMQGKPLTVEQLEQLAGEGASGDELTLLVDLVGFAEAGLSPTQALELVRAGVPRPVIAHLRQLAHTRPPQEDAAAGDLPQPGYYPHPLGLFTLRYPTTWKLLREIEDGSVIYTVTPERDTQHRDDLTVGLDVVLFSMQKDAIIAGMPPPQALLQLLPLFQQEEPGMRPVGEVAEATLGGLQGARQVLEGTLRDKQGTFHGELYFGRRDNLVYMAAAFAPQERFADFSAAFADILQRSSFVAGKTPGSREQRFTVANLVAGYKRSVVSIRTYRDNEPYGTGSGFVIREDGYILTNHHVVWDADNNRPLSRFVVDWDSDLGLPSQEAQLVAYKVTPGLVGFQTGIDLALLKIPSGRPYTPIPLTPLTSVQLGEPVLTMGFPARGLLPGLSLVVTSGVVTRFNRDPLGKVATFYIDAPIAKGSSGGPSLSLVTGGVIGLNTFGVNTTMAERFPELALLVDYHGVVPIDYALQEFPLATRISVAREQRLDATDYFELALRSADVGALSGAVRMAKQAVEHAQGAADPLSLLGRLQLLAATDEESRQAALRTLQRVLTLDPKHQETLLFLAEVNVALGEPVDAMQYANRAVEAKPEDWSAYLARARVNLAVKRYDDALADVAKAKQLSRNVLPGPYLLAGEVFYARGAQAHGSRADLDHGKQEFREALHIHPANLEARLGVARFSMLTKNYLSALLEYSRINEDHPGTPPVLAAMGRAYAQLSKYDRAMPQYLEAIRRWGQFNQIPPEAVYLEAATVASEHLHKTELSIVLYTRYLLHYFEAAQAFDVHMALAKLFEAQKLPGIARGHVVWANNLRHNIPAVQQELNALRNATMSRDDIERMLKLNYPPSVAGKIVSVTPLDFKVQSKAEVAELLKTFPEPVVVGILESQRTYAARQQQQGQPRQPEQAARGGDVSQALTGIWEVKFTTRNGTAANFAFNLVADGRYVFVTILGDQKAKDTGTYTLNGDRLIFTSTKGRGRYFLQVRLDGDRLIVSDPQFGDLAYHRVRGG